MYNKEILLGSAKHKLGINEDNFIHVELSSSKRDLGITDSSYAVDEYLQYYYEKDESQDYRLAFTITPYCTNVLFNAITEPVCYEGDNDCFLITKEGKTISNNQDLSYYHSTYKGNSATITLNQAVKDTGYSLLEAGNVKYHCGWDIFNNHYFRKLGFVAINKMTDNTTSKSSFNSIGDKFRDNEGNEVMYQPLTQQDNFPIGSSAPKCIYNKATILNYAVLDGNNKIVLESVDANLSEENGWFGFVNKSIIPVKNYTDKDGKVHVINKCMNDYQSGDFVDMYPDRTLFSFVPKYNEYRKRFEKNWDYCITYPASSTTDNYLIQDTGSTQINGILAVKITEVTSVSSYPSDTMFKTGVNHNLNTGDYVTISFILYNGEEKKTNFVRVSSVGIDDGDKQHYFSVKTINIINELFNSQNQPFVFSQIRVRKCENGQECNYYVRKFAKLKTDADFNSQLNKLGFSQNAYSDPVAQIVFTDDIGTYELYDNLNRPISELYLTIVKQNKGHNKWYSNGGSGDKDVEFSHCFGKVTSGFDLPKEYEFSELNIHRIHNITGGINGIPSSPSCLSEEGGEVNIDNDWFYGDIVEFSPSAFRETVLTPVYHRFNTAQREWQGSGFDDFNYNEIGGDVYDYSRAGTPSTIVYDYSINNRFGVSRINLFPEGYYYQAHYPIKIREFDEEVSEGNHIELVYTAETQTSPNYAIINLEENYYFQTGITKVYAYKKINGKYYSLISEGTCVNVSKDFKTVAIQFDNSIDISGDCKLFKHNTEMPAYAYDFKDGSGKYVWRELKSFADITSDSELYDSMFKNGAHYHHKNISFYLKRQDPEGEYGIGKEPQKLSEYFIIENEHKDVSKLEYIKETDSVKC